MSKNPEETCGEHKKIGKLITKAVLILPENAGKLHGTMALTNT